MRAKNTSSSNIDACVVRSVNFELTIADLARRGERRAWCVAWSAIALSLSLAGGYFYMLPLKQKVPFLVMADAYTGTSTVARLVASPELEHITTSQAINRSNIAHYVMARESYDITLMRLQDWTTVLTMSAPGVAAAYRAAYSPSNPDNPQKRYGNDQAIRVRILSIVLLGPQGTTPTGATVRFQRSLYNKADGGSHPLDNRIATMAFGYKPELQMADQYRIENPLGFQVTDYRVDNDLDATPPSANPQSIPDDVPAALPVHDGALHPAPSSALPTPATDRVTKGAPDQSQAQSRTGSTRGAGYP